MRTTTKALAWLICVAAAVAAGGGMATAAESKDVLELRALTWHQGGDVRITVPAAVGGAAITRFEHVQVRLIPPGETEVARVVNRRDVEAKEGVAGIALGPVEPGTKLDVQAHVRTDDAAGTTILRGDAIARLRPDLVVAAVHAPEQTLSTRPVDVVADVEELNGQTGATATLTLVLGPTPLSEPKTVTIVAGATKTVTFEGVKLETATTAELTVRVEDAAPFETDTTNNARTRAIEVTEHELVRSNVLVPSLAGYGAQFNNHVYAPITPWPAGTSYDDFEAKAKALQPHIVRIFYQDNWDGNRNGMFPDWEKNYASFVKVVRLAQDAGAIIDISFQNLANARSTPGPDMAKFADVLHDLIRNHGLTNVRWAEVGNEPNSGGLTAVSLSEYDVLVRTLDEELRARGLREHIRLMGPRPGRERRRPDADALRLDAVDRGQHGRRPRRLGPARVLVLQRRGTARVSAPGHLAPAERGDPAGTAEADLHDGVRHPRHRDVRRERRRSRTRTTPPIPPAQRSGARTSAASSSSGSPSPRRSSATWARRSGTRTGAFTTARSPHRRCTATIAPPTEGWSLTPSYHSLALLFHTTVPGWQVVRSGRGTRATGA